MPGVQQTELVGAADRLQPVVGVAVVADHRKAEKARLAPNFRLILLHDDTQVGHVEAALAEILVAEQPQTVN